MLSKLKIANFPAVPPSRKTVAATLNDKIENVSNNEKKN